MIKESPADEKLENTIASLSARLNQREQEIAVINAVQEGLAKQIDMQGIFDLVGEKIKNLFGSQVQSMVIATFDLEPRTEHFRYCIEKGERAYPPPRPFDKLRSSLAEGKDKVIINNPAESYAWFEGKVIVGKPMKSGVFIPLLLGDKITGYMSLQNVDIENAFSDSDVQLLETLSNSMSLALENALLFDKTNRLLKETEQQKAELAVINSVQEGLARELDIHAIYELVGDRLVSLFPHTQTLVIRTFDHESGTEYFQYTIEKGKRYFIQPRPFLWANKLLFDAKKALYFNENYDETARRYSGSSYTAGQAPKCAVFVPMVVGDIVKGSISLQNVDKENAFSQSDIRLLTTLTNSMSVALENARLFDETNRLLKETEQRTAELAVINSVQEGLVSEMDMQGIYDLVGDRVQQLFNAQVVVISSFDIANSLENFNYMIENGEKQKLITRPIDKLRQLLIKQRRTIYIETEDQAIHEYGLTPIADTAMSKSMVFVPMISGSDMKGYVSLQNVDEEHAFSVSDIRLLETLSNSMSVALENARLFDETNRLLKETEQRTAELAVINSVQDGLAKEMDMQGIYDLVGDRVQQLFNAQSVIIASFDLANNLENFNYAIENGIKYKHSSRPINKLRQLLIKQRRTLNIETEEQAVNEYGSTAIGNTKMAKSMVFVPMLAGSDIKGYVSLQNVDEEHAFSAPDIRLLETLSNSMSVALENARLFDETNRLLKETEQRTAELAVINSIQEGLVSEMDMQGIYNLVGDRVQQLFNAQAVIIASFDLPNNLENFNYAIENGDKQKLEPRPINKLRQLLIEKRHTIYIETQEQAVTEYGLTAIENTEMPKSLLFVPLLTGSEIKGYVSLQNVDEEHAFSASDVRLLETLSNSMTVALENARLFDETNRLLKETEQRTAELAVINSVQEGLVREIDIQAIYDLVGDRLCKLFPDTQTLVIRTFDYESGNEQWQYAIEKGVRLRSDPRPFNWANKRLIAVPQPLYIAENYVETAKKFGGSGVTEGKPPKCAVFVPMIVGDSLKGSVSLQNVDIEHAFSDSDVRLLTTLTNSMSVALENARLFDETNRLLKETEQRTAELAVINSVQEGLVREMDIQAIYEIVGARLCDLFNIQTVLIRTLIMITE